MRSGSVVRTSKGIVPQTGPEVYWSAEEADPAEDGTGRGDQHAHGLDEEHRRLLGERDVGAGQLDDLDEVGDPADRKDQDDDAPDAEQRADEAALRVAEGVEHGSGSFRSDVVDEEHVANAGEVTVVTDVLARDPLVQFLDDLVAGHVVPVERLLERRQVAGDREVYCDHGDQLASACFCAFFAPMMYAW